MESSPVGAEGSDEVEVNCAFGQRLFFWRTVVVDLLLQLHISIHVVGHGSAWIFENAVERGLCFSPFDIGDRSEFSSECTPDGRGRFEMSDTSDV